MWEDASNVDGGRWLINSVKQHRQQVLDRLWLETLLCLIGEIFEDASDEGKRLLLTKSQVAKRL